MAKILIIEDEPAIRNVLSNIIQEENSSYKVDIAENGLEGLEKISNHTYDLVLCDIKMPKMDGMELLTKAMKDQPDLTMVMISGHGDIDTAVDCIKKGAYDYISKPPDLNRLLNTVRNGLDRKKLVVQNKVLKKKVTKKYEMIGDSPELAKIHQMIDRVAPTDARVLITGANGTGKELIAHAIHEKSGRSKAPMIEVNCAAIPSELIESELFGHEKGAFTSAIKQRKGKFETADGGTLFLDEIGELPRAMQAKLLRFLESGEIRRVGENSSIIVDVRVLCATHRNLPEMVANDEFREDLMFRINTFEIALPSLRERIEDLPSLVDHLLGRFSSGASARKNISPAAVEVLMGHSWPGNIRELANAIQHATILCDE